MATTYAANYWADYFFARDEDEAYLAREAQMAALFETEEEREYVQEREAEEALPSEPLPEYIPF